MKIKVIQVGKTKDRYFRDAVAEFEKRVSPYANLEIMTLKEVSASKTVSKESCKEEEGRKILKALDERAFVVALDEGGKEFTSPGFAKFLSGHKDVGRTVIFVIGGTFGLTEEVRQRADLVMSMSQMTFTHQMIRPFLLEQIYRGLMIIVGKEYHV